MRHFHSFCFAALVLSLTACAHYQPPDGALDSSKPDYTPAIRSHSKTPGLEEPPKPDFEPNGALTLRDAWALTLLRNPSLAATSLAPRIAEARALQAGRAINPELAIDIENVAGSGSFSGTQLQETTLGISQVLELGGKRSKRARIASLEAELTGWDYEAQRIELLLEVARRTIEVVAAQELLKLSHDTVALSERVSAVVEKRIGAGLLSPVESDRQLVETELARTADERAVRQLNIARHRLAALWGSLNPTFDRVRGKLNEFAKLPTLESLASLIEGNPEIARWAVEMTLRRASLESARTEAMPDVTAGVGVRRYNETKDHAFVFGLSMPLPLFDRNQGEVLASRFELEQGEQQRRAVEVAVKTNLLEAYETLAADQGEALALRDKALPAVKRTFDSVKEGFEQGQFDFTTVLDAQRTLFALQSRYIEALKAARIAAAEVEALIGQSLESVDPGDPVFIR